MIRAIFAMTACLTISACDQFIGDVNEAESLLDGVRGIGVTPTASLPTGTATYQGRSVWQSGPYDEDADSLGIESGNNDLIENAILVSDARVDANFDTGALSGRLTDFVDEDNNELSGSLTLDGVIFDNSGESAAASNVAGTLDGDAITGGVAGVFGGDDAEAILLLGQLDGFSDYGGTVSGAIVGRRD